MDRSQVSDDAGIADLPAGENFQNYLTVFMFKNINQG